MEFLEFARVWCRKGVKSEVKTEFVTKEGRVRWATSPLVVTIQGSSVGYVVMMASIIEAKIRVEVVRIMYLLRGGAKRKIVTR